jgi:hypothetical protein
LRRCSRKADADWVAGPMVVVGYVVVGYLIVRLIPGLEQAPRS